MLCRLLMAGNGGRQVRKIGTLSRIGWANKFGNIVDKPGLVCRGVENWGRRTVTDTLNL